MSCKIVLVILALVLNPFMLFAKASQPVKAILIEKSQSISGDQVEYKIDFSCITRLQSKKAIFKLNLDPKATLLEGFTYWEGEVKNAEEFTKSLLIQAPQGVKITVTVIAEIHFSDSHIATVAAGATLEKKDGVAKKQTPQKPKNKKSWSWFKKPGERSDNRRWRE